MADVSTPETDKAKQDNPSPGYSRRQFLKGVAAVGAALLTPAVLASRATAAPSPGGGEAKDAGSGPTPTETSKSLEDIIIERLRNLDIDEKDKQTLTEEAEAIKEKHAEFSVKYAEFLKIVDEDRVNGAPRLWLYYMRLLGGLRTYRPEQLYPFSDVYRNLKSNRDSLFFLTGKWVSSDSSPEEYQKEAHELAEKIRFIKFEEQRRQKRETRLRVNASTSRVGIDALQRSELAAEVVERISGFFKAFPDYDRLPTVIDAYSKEFLGQKGGYPDNLAGRFLSSREDLGHMPEDRGLIMADYALRQMPELEEELLVHEMIGHRFDPAFAAGIFRYLKPLEFYQFLISYTQAMEDPKWGGRDWGIPAIFSNYYLLRGNRDFLKGVRGGRKVSEHEFMDLITQYPHTAILTNYMSLDKDGRHLGVFDIGTKKYDQNGNPYFEDQDQPIELDFKVDKNEQVLANRNKTSGTFTQFREALLKEYKSVVEVKGRGSRRAALIIWALEKYAPYLNNTRFAFGWNTRKALNIEAPDNLNPEVATLAQWEVYCNTVVLNAALYHGFLSQVEEDSQAVRGLFNNAMEQSNIEANVKALKERNREEMWAEGLGYAFVFGDKVERTSYHQALDQIRGLIKLIASRVSAEKLIEESGESERLASHQQALKTALAV